MDFLQQNWALIDKIDEARVTVFFLGGSSTVFDGSDFATIADAKAGLLANDFKRFAGVKKAEQFLVEPPPPFEESHHSVVKIYSSGPYWNR